MSVGASWVVIAAWAAAGADTFGSSIIVTPDGFLSAEEALGFATLGARGAHQLSNWRRRVPLPVRTAAKDVRMYRDARRPQLPTDLQSLDDEDVPFVWQHHGLFQSGGAQLAQRLDVPLVIAVEALQIPEASAWGVSRPGWGDVMHRRGELRQLGQADLITCVSVELAERVASAGLAESKIMVTPNMVDTRRFDGIDRKAARNEFGLDGRFVVGWVGSFRSFHALDVLLDAFERFVAVAPEATLVLVGDGPEREHCVEFGRRFAERQVVLPGAVPFDEIPMWISSFDAAVLPARADEAFHYSPIKLQEYKAAGVATVAPRLGQVRDVIEDGSTGLLYEPGDDVQLADHLVGLHSDATARSRLASAGAADVRRPEYGTSGLLRQIEDRLK
jgi:glycosyltransferase involved in cell wall biosynthesis